MSSSLMLLSRRRYPHYMKVYSVLLINMMLLVFPCPGKNKIVSNRIFPGPRKHRLRLPSAPGSTFSREVVVVVAGGVHPLIPRSGRGLRRWSRVRRLQRRKGREGGKGGEVPRHVDRVGPQVHHRQWRREGRAVEQMGGRVSRSEAFGARVGV